MASNSLVIDVPGNRDVAALITPWLPRGGALRQRVGGAYTASGGGPLVGSLKLSQPLGESRGEWG